METGLSSEKNILPVIAIISLQVICLRGLKGKIYFSPCFFRLVPVRQSLCSCCAGLCLEVASFSCCLCGFFT